jgi:hypothetical protein
MEMVCKTASEAGSKTLATIYGNGFKTASEAGSKTLITIYGNGL